MATINASTSEKVFSLTAFLGLNQNPDGDTKLKMGEAADMYNFRVTRDRNLQRRPGTKTMKDTETGKPIKVTEVINEHTLLVEEITPTII